MHFYTYTYTYSVGPKGAQTLDIYPPIVGRIYPIPIYRFNWHIFPQQKHQGLIFSGARLAGEKHPRPNLPRTLLQQPPAQTPLCEVALRVGVRLQVPIEASTAQLALLR